MLSNLLEPGQVLAGAPTATPTVVWAPEVPPGPQWLMDLSQPGPFPPLARARAHTHTHTHHTTFCQVETALGDRYCIGNWLVF